ncbi:hypothetical protein PLESTF_001971200 [Pleodorina starrii]|nr:hypothetical protein PLESTF_001971200 [Pleodorina starrii]
MRRLCLRAPDKADCRQMAVTSVQALMSSCTADEIRTFCLFLYRLSRTQKGGNRIVAVDLAGALLSTIPAPFQATGAYQRLVEGSCGAGEELEAPWSAICLAIVVSRSNDKSASVRGKAISCLADCAQSFAKRLLDAPAGGQAASETAAFLPALCACRSIQVQVAQPRGAAAGGAGDESDDGDGAAGEQDPDAAGGPPPEVVVKATIPGKVSLELSWIRSMCHARCRDEKAAVRKVALQLLESVLELCAAAARGRPAAAAAGRPAPAADGPTVQDVQVLEEATADSLVSVRKAALQVVCNLVACYPQHSELACVWARCVLPLLRDPESAVQEAVLDRLSVLLLEPLAVLGRRGGGGRGGAAAATVTAAQQQADADVRQRLAALAQLGRAASSCLCRALATLSAKKLLKGAQVAAGLEAFLTAGREAAAEEQGASATGKAGARRTQQETEEERQQRRAARDQREGAWMVLVEVAGQDPSAPSWQFLHRCWTELQAAGAGGGTEVSAQEGAMLLWVISHAASRFPAGDAANLASGLLEAILGFNLPAAAVAAHLAALHKLTQADGGQAVVGSPAKWCARVQEACEEVLAKAMEARGNMSKTLATHCQLALFTLGEVALLRETGLPSGAAVKVQALTYNRSGSQGGPAAGHVAQTAVSAHAWTCLGKMCMVEESLAKKCVPLLVQEMSGSPSPVVRTNLLVGLADMVVQFTGLADAYVGRLADMVRDPHELVRRQALALLANLLLRDYVKWRGSLVHRFLLALVDESLGVRELAQYLLSDSLAAKAPMLAYNHFIESLFVLNDCSAGLHASRSGGGSSELASELTFHAAFEGGRGFHLKGSTPIMRAKRDIIYTALLRRMSPEHRFAAFARLTAEVLGGVVDQVLPLAEADEVLGDALRLLACKDMKVNVNRFGAPAEEDGTVDQLTGTQEDATKARGKLVGAMMKKHLAESVVPLMVELRYMLQAQKHPLLGSLMLCMASLLRDFKSEVGDILVSDKQLALELMHDLKHYDSLAKQQQQQQEAAMAAALAPKRPAPGDNSSGAAAAQGNTASVTSAKTAAAAQVVMPPPPAPADPQRRKTIVLPGVEPSRTPLAAEVLGTASKRGRAPQNSTQHTPHGAAGPSAGPSAVAMTPAPGLPAAGAMRTPLTGLLGTAQRGLPGGLNIMLSPAPLSARARAGQQHRVPGAGAGAPPLSAAGLARARATTGAAAGSVDPEQPRVTVILPSPMPNAQKNPAARPPLGPHNQSGDPAAAAQPHPGKPPLHRTPPAALAAAVRAARDAAAAAVADENDKATDVAPMDVDGAAGAREDVVRSGGEPSKGHDDGGKVKREPKAKQEPAGPAAAVGPVVAMEWQVPEVKQEVGGAARGGKGRSSKRRHAA